MYVVRLPGVRGPGASDPPRWRARASGPGTSSPAAEQRLPLRGAGPLLWVVVSPPVVSPLDQFRAEFGRRIRLTLSGSPDLADRSIPVADDPGLFGPHSATWEVHADASMIIGGLRALLLQTLHPPTMAGVADHSDYRRDPLGRLQRTAGFVATTTFGTRAEAEQAIDSVRHIHTRVVGLTPIGEPYDATDPHLLEWVHCTEIDSFLRARCRYGAAPLTTGAADRYVDEMAEVARRLGIPDPPRSRASLKVRLCSYRPELHVGRQARDTIRFLAWPPLPLTTRPTYGLVFTAAVSMLPRFARRMLRLPVAPLAEPLAIRPAATVLMRTLGWALGDHPSVAEPSGRRCRP